MKNKIAPADSLRCVYGLNVKSDIGLPELQSVTDEANADIMIQQGSVAETTVSNPRDIRNYLDGCSGRLWLNLPEIMRMEITDGRTITYDRYPGVEDDEVRLFLLGSGLGAILMQRGFIVIHGNAVVTEEDDGALLCIGDTGAGKSTTAIAMMQRGLKVLADDVCPLDAEGLVLPGMARAKLWQETASQLGIDTSRLSRIRKADAKFNLPLGNAHCAKQQSVRAFYWLVPGDIDEVSIRQVQGVEKFTVLRNNVYRPEYLRLLGLEADYLRNLSHIAATTPVFEISRPNKGFEIDSLLDTILSNDQRQRQETQTPSQATTKSKEATK